MVALNDIYVKPRPARRSSSTRWRAQGDHRAASTCRAAGTTGGFFPGSRTGLEAEVHRGGVASLNLTRDAAQLVREILPCYQATITNPNCGRPFNEVYNVETVQPTTEWLDMYFEVKEDLRRIGLRLA